MSGVSAMTPGTGGIGIGLVRHRNDQCGSTVLQLFESSPPGTVLGTVVRVICVTVVQVESTRNCYSCPSRVHPELLQFLVDSAQTTVTQMTRTTVPNTVPGGLGSNNCNSSGWTRLGQL